MIILPIENVRVLCTKQTRNLFRFWRDAKRPSVASKSWRKASSFIQQEILDLENFGAVRGRFKGVEHRVPAEGYANVPMYNNLIMF